MTDLLALLDDLRDAQLALLVHLCERNLDRARDALADAIKRRNAHRTKMRIRAGVPPPPNPPIRIPPKGNP